MKLKLNRERLIKALEKAKTDAEKQYEKDERQYRYELARAESKHLSNVASYLGKLRHTKPGQVDRYGLTDLLFEGVNLPVKPKPPKPEYIDALVAELRLSDCEHVVCDNKEDYVKLTRAINVSQCRC